MENVRELTHLEKIHIDGGNNGYIPNTDFFSKNFAAVFCQGMEDTIDFFRGIGDQFGNGFRNNYNG
ncbi:hypothetical protein [Echinicola salinicaeni]|uniref:hypothetical protein n=1 Tax=Echinicola salinicaeni TaxID=2762757 RepID=UPI001649368D|nr:hypothetical protein [Echinicola salinicaeni]